MNKAYILNNTLLVESSIIIDPTLLTALEQALVLVQQRLQTFASDVEFAQKMTVAFGEDVEVNSLRAAWLTGDFSIFPEIEIRNAAELNGAHGAYGATTNRIYLSWEFLPGNQGNIESFVGLLLEEFGHRVDVVLNSSDSAGDEGAIFSALVQGYSLDDQTLQALKAEDDSGIVTVNGEAIGAFNAATRTFSVTPTNNVGILR
jgi:hypothetical protein